MPPKGMTAEEIFTAGENRKTTLIKVDEWKTGAVVYTALLSGSDTEIVLDYIEERAQSEKAGSKSDEVRAMARVCMVGVTDEEGKRLFEANDNSAAILMAAPFIVLDRICKVILDTNGLSNEARKELEKN